MSHDSTISSSPAIKSSNSQVEFLLDEAGWKDEAAGVIKDISSYVTSVAVAETLPCSNSQIFLNLVTKENKNFTVALNPEGFKIVGFGLNTIDTDGETIYETPYSLLDNISPAYREAFGNHLTDELLKLQKLQDEEEQQ